MNSQQVIPDGHITISYCGNVMANMHTLSVCQGENSSSNADNAYSKNLNLLTITDLQHSEFDWHNHLTNI